MKYSEITMKRTHKGEFGYAYIYYRNDNDDDDNLCRECAEKLWLVDGLLPNSSSQYRSIAVEGSISLMCSRCNCQIQPYWACCLNVEAGSLECAPPRK